MSFDKTKAMRNAERFLSQGKIRAAIGEYRQVVDNDAKDISTLNLLGDLYTKNSQKNEAIRCYQAVAEHYSNQGFAQKAIAVYNKIVKLEPNSVEISGKLAELYKLKGSVTEARSHYITLAQHYQSKGRKIEALAIWEQIALLDPNNTEVYPTIAQSYADEGALEEAAEAWAEAGLRFAQLGRSTDADSAFSKALELRPSDAKALSGFVAAKFAAGAMQEAFDKLDAVLEAEPHNRDVLALQAVCFMRAQDIQAAEKVIIRLVELEPAYYPKFLELAQYYLGQSDTVSATRVLSMASEHLLVGGQSAEFDAMVTQLLAADPENLEALRLKVRFSTWQRDEASFRESLENLAGAANRAGSAEDERFALTQLVMIVPQEPSYAERLNEVNELLGHEPSGGEESLFDKQFLKEAIPELAAEAVSIDEPASAEQGSSAAYDLAAEPSLYEMQADDDLFVPEIERAGVIEVEGVAFESAGVDHDAYTDSPEARLRKEAESIKFYIESGYTELAEKAIYELRGEFGEQPEIDELQTCLKEYIQAATDEPIVADPAPVAAGSFELTDLRSELGLEEPEAADDSDYETHYHTAVAYQEMGLVEDAIKEFQEAVGLVHPHDGTRRFFQCANLLGHCFMQKGMPNLALTWYQRTLETPGLDDEEKQALWYELAAAYEAEGDLESAERYFEQVYAENINFRDVSQRVKNMAVNRC